jgi:hypothetical protein
VTTLVGIDSISIAVTPKTSLLRGAITRRFPHSLLTTLSRTRRREIDRRITGKLTRVGCSGRAVMWLVSPVAFMPFELPSPIQVVAPANRYIACCKCRARNANVRSRDASTNQLSIPPRNGGRTGENGRASSRPRVRGVEWPTLLPRVASAFVLAPARAWSAPSSRVAVVASRRHRESPSSRVAVVASHRRRESPSSRVVVIASHRRRESPSSRVTVVASRRHRESPSSRSHRELCEWSAPSPRVTVVASHRRRESPSSRVAPMFVTVPFVTGDRWDRGRASRAFGSVLSPHRCGLGLFGGVDASRRVEWTPSHGVIRSRGTVPIR